MSNENLKFLIREHIKSIGIKNIKKMFKEINFGPTNEEFFGEQTAETINRKIKGPSVFKEHKECFLNLNKSNLISRTRPVRKIDVFNKDNNYDPSMYNKMKEVA